MSKVFKAVGAVASIAAMIPGPHQPFAQAIAVAANVGAALTAKPPPAKGSVNQVMIGANMPTPCAIGRTYIGGNMVHDVGYGGSTNPYKTMAVVWSLGPVHSIEAFQADFSTISFSGGNAVGYYNGFLYTSTSLGPAPQPTALAGPFGAIPGWGSTAKISGKCHGLITLKFDKKGKRFASGPPQFGVVLKGALCYDPRKDSTYPGGSGAHRFDDEATWEWSENPALHGIAYARGRYHNGKKVFGCGFSKDAIDLAAFVAFANLCDANGWTVGGVIYEPGSRKDNLKYILEAGGGEPVFGARLSVRYAAPKVAVDTISAVDLADGEYVVPAMRSWRDRINTIVPKYRSPDHKWEYVQSDAVTVPAYVTEDGEEKPEERQWSLVQDKDQVAQLAAYALVDAREVGPIVLPFKPRLASYRIGEVLNCDPDMADLGLAGLDLEIIDKSVDPATAIVTLTFRTETSSKHAFALGRTGTAPPTPTIVAPDVIDELIAGNRYTAAPHVVADEAAMLALEVNEGAVAIRTDQQTTYIHNGGTTGTAADWTEALSPPPPTLDAKLQALAATTWAGNALKLLQVNATENGWQFTASAGGESVIIAGTTAQYWRGDKTWQTLNATAVGLGNVNNTADSTKVVASAAKLTTARTIDGQSFDGSANVTVIAPGTNAATSKATPVDADALPLVDSAATNTLKKLTWANLKATLKTYLDTLYLGKTNPTATGRLEAQGVRSTGDAGAVAGTTGSALEFNYNHTQEHAYLAALTRGTFSWRPMTFQASKYAFMIEHVPNYASDAAAAGGGVAVGGIYRNGSALMVRVA